MNDYADFCEKNKHVNKLEFILLWRQRAVDS